MATDSTTTEDQRAARLQENRNLENQQSEEAEPTGANAQPRARHINGAEAVFLVLFAVACSLAIPIANAIFPLLGSVVGGIVWLTFYLWLKFKIMKGAPKIWSRLLTMSGFAEIIIGIIPGISAVPFWLGFVILIIIADKIGRLPFFENFLQSSLLNRL